MQIPFYAGSTRKLYRVQASNNIVRDLQWRLKQVWYQDTADESSAPSEYLEFNTETLMAICPYTRT